MAACDGIWGHCGKLEEALQHSAIRTEQLEERVHGPDGSRTAAMRAARAEAENEQLRSQLAHERRSVQRLSLQAMQINSQLMHAKASEAAMREGVESIKREFRASRLALLLRAARDRADRNEMEVYCKTLREWTIETLGDKVLNPTFEPGWEDVFVPLAVVDAPMREGGEPVRITDDGSMSAFKRLTKHGLTPPALVEHEPVRIEDDGSMAAFKKLQRRGLVGGLVPDLHLGRRIFADGDGALS